MNAMESAKKSGSAGRPPNEEIFSKAERKIINHLIDGLYSGDEKKPQKLQRFAADFMRVNSATEIRGRTVQRYTAPKVEESDSMPEGYRERFAKTFSDLKTRVSCCELIKEIDALCIQIRETNAENKKTKAGVPKPDASLPEPMDEVEPYSVARYIPTYEDEVEEVCREMEAYLGQADWNYEEFPNDNWLKLLEIDGDHAEMVLRDTTGRIIAYVIQCALKDECFNKLLGGAYEDKHLGLNDTVRFKGNKSINLYLVATAVRTSYRMEDLESKLIHYYIKKMKQWMMAGEFNVRRTACVCINTRDERMMKGFGMRRLAGVQDKNGMSVYYCDGFLRSPSDLSAPHSLPHAEGPNPVPKSDHYSIARSQPSVGRAYTHHELRKKRSIKSISSDLDLLDEEFNEELGVNSEDHFVPNEDWVELVKRDHLSCFYICDETERIIGYVFQVPLTDGEMSQVLAGTYQESSFANKASPIGDYKGGKNIYIVNVCLLKEYRGDQYAFLRLIKKYRATMREALGKGLKIKNLAAVCATEMGQEMAEALLEMQPVVRRKNAPDKKFWWIYRMTKKTAFGV